MIIQYKFMGIRRYHEFTDLCYKLGITVFVTKEDNNFGKKETGMVFRRHININDEQKKLLIDFDYRIIE